MRCLLRVAVVGSLLILFFVFLAFRSSRQSSLDQQETDEAIRLLLATGDDPQASAGLPQNSERSNRPSTDLTFNVAIVLVVSLLSVALLITGIIIVAVTLDPGDERRRLATSRRLSTDSDQHPFVFTRRDSDDDSGGEFGDLNADAECRTNSHHWDPEAQVFGNSFFPILQIWSSAPEWAPM